MITFDNGVRLVEDVAELPRPPAVILNLYEDLETTSGHPKLDSLNPWYHCSVAGICVTWDDVPGAWYVPVGHHDKRWNLPRDKVIAWQRDVMRSAKRWVNHNVKYDAHVLYNDLDVDALEYDVELVCTVVRSKIKDSDRAFRGGYGLDALSLAWLNEDISQFEQRLKPYLEKNEDYGAIPADVLGEYGGQDVISNRHLNKWLVANMYEEAAPVVATETRLTAVLVDAERTGMVVVPQELQIARLKCLYEMLQIQKELHDIVGYPFIPTSTNDCYDVLCNHYGLPVLSWTNEDDDEKQSNPSFKADVLKAYAHRVDAPKRVVELMIEYRSLATLKGLFLETFEELAIADAAGEARLHTDHNQCVRTGRMSAKKPNSQQNDKRSKKLIHPGNGMSFFSKDASQIEFRTITHYCQDWDVINKYREDPDVDFHQFVAEMCGIKRRPAKTVNFAVAFGQGKGSTVALLATDEDVVSSILNVIEELIQTGEMDEAGQQAMFATMSRQRGEAVYDRYHSTFPRIKITARQAMHACRERGFIRNIRGRRRYLPKEHSHKSFNTLNQSSAADIIKERMVALYDAYKGTPIKIVTQVHDEILSVGPTEVIDDPRTKREVIALLEDNHELRVPLRFKYGTSNVDWAEASSQDLSVSYEEVLQLQEKAKDDGWLSHLR